MLKSFDALRKIDVIKYCDFREAKDENGNKIKVPYLNWAKCVDLLHENGAETVYFTPCVNENGSSLFMTEIPFTDKYEKTNRCYEVRVHIVIDDIEFDMQTPLLNGTAVVNDQTINQLRVGNAQARAFVKGVAIRTGLGFQLWSDHEAKDEIIAAEQKIFKVEDLKGIKEEFQRIYTDKLKKGLSQEEIAQKLNTTKDTIRANFAFFDLLATFGEELSKL